LTAFSFAGIRVRIVRRRTVKPPFRVVAQRCVNPRQLKLSGFPSNGFVPERVC
jgi:hypothetical protein